MHCWQVVAASPGLFQGMAVGVGVGPTAEQLLPPLRPDLLPSQVGCVTKHLNRCTLDLPLHQMEKSANVARSLRCVCLICCLYIAQAEGTYACASPVGTCPCCVISSLMFSLQVTLLMTHTRVRLSGLYLCTSLHSQQYSGGHLEDDQSWDCRTWPAFWTYHHCLYGSLAG